MKVRMGVVAFMILLAAVTAIRARMTKAKESAPEITTGAGTGPETPAVTPKDSVSEQPAKPGRTLRIPDFAAGSLVDPNAPPHPLAAYMSRRDAEIKKWRAAIMSLKFEETPIRDVLALFLREYNLLANLDAALGADHEVTFRVEQLDGHTSMDLITKMLGLAWVITESGESWLVPKEKVAMYEPEAFREMTRMQGVATQVTADREGEVKNPANEKVEQALSTALVSGSFTNTQIYDVIDSLQEQSKLNVMIERKALPHACEKHIDVTFKDKPLKDALAEVLSESGLIFMAENGLVLIRAKKTQEDLEAKKADADKAKAARAKIEDDFFSKRVTLPAEDLFIRDVAELLSKATGVGYVIDPASWSRAANYGFDGKERTIREIADILAKGAPVRLAYREDRMWFLDRAAPAPAK